MYFKISELSLRECSENRSKISNLENLENQDFGRLKGNSTVKTSWAQIKDNTFNKLLPKYLGPNHFSKGEVVRQSSRICQISTPCCSFPCRRESGQRPDL